MIVLAPARDIGPGDRRILAAGDLKRQFKLWIWQVTDGTAPDAKCLCERA